MLIKASAITNLTDARYFAAKEVHFLGFNLEEGTEGFLDPMYMKAIREWVQGPVITGEFDRTPAQVVREAAAFYGLEAVQVTQTAGLDLLEGLDVLLALPADANPDTMAQRMQAVAPQVRYFLLDFTAGAAGLKTHTPAWKALFERFPVLLYLDMPADELARLLDVLQPAGLALRGGAEEKVGVKSFEAIDAVFEALGMG